MTKTSCHICESPAYSLFQKRILHRYDVNYFKCCNCGFLQTETPYWLDDAYDAPVNPYDIGAVQRNLQTASITSNLLSHWFDPTKRFLDYGGGTGLFVRLMRDAGYDFYRYDRFCPNIYAAAFDLSDSESDHGFELVTSFEVLEHSPAPLDDFRAMFTLSDSLFCTTCLQPDNPDDLIDWSYLAPYCGQHIGFFTVKSLEIVADRLSRHLSTNGRNLHLLTSRKLQISLQDLTIDKRPTKNLIRRLLDALHPQPAETRPTRVSLSAHDFDLILARAKTMHYPNGKRQKSGHL